MVLREITDEVMYRLRELSGQEYVNRYAKRKDAVEGIGAEPAQVPAVLLSPGVEGAPVVVTA
jgi:hypothetical protein